MSTSTRTPAAITLTTHGDKQYKVCNGTYYHVETSDHLVTLLETLRLNQTRIRLDYGDTTTGKSWGEHYDIVGHISRSTGPVRIPILIHNVRSMGGGAILTHCIIKIVYANKKQGGTIYQHAHYQPADE